MLEELTCDFDVPSHVLCELQNPVDVSRIRLEALSNHRGSGGAGRCFVAAGRLTTQKGFDRLLEMFAESAGPEDRLAILGEGPLGEELRQRVNELGIGERVNLTGFLDNPWAWFAAADAFLLPSRWEGMPNVALEALACGLPVIATPESGGIAEVAAVAAPGAVQVVKAGNNFIQAMREVPCRPKDTLPKSLLPPQYQLESVVDTFASWLTEID